MAAIRTLLASLTLAAAAVTQAPDGWIVLSAQSKQSDGGLYLLHPRNAGPSGIGTQLPILVTGLATELTGQDDGVTRGASSVEIERDTGYVLVGEAGPVGTGIELHRLQITTNGVTANQGQASATLVSKTLLGISIATNGGVEDMAMLPNGDLVLALSDLAVEAPLNGNRLARFSPATGTLTPIVTNAPVGSIRSVAADPTGGTIYFHVLPPGSPTQGDLYRCSVLGGSVTRIRGVAHFRNMTVDDRGHIHAVGNTYSLELDPVTGSTLGSNLFNIRSKGVAIERATQIPIYVVSSENSEDGVYVGGSEQLVSRSIPDLSTGIAIQDSPSSYGLGTSGVAAYSWGGTPSADSLPLAGNQAFSIQIDASDAVQYFGVLFVSPESGSSVIVGADVLIDLNVAAFVGPINAGVPIPIPLPATLPPGADFFFQGAFLDGSAPGGIATSDALRVGVIR